jgi:hypothetical protein
LKLGLSLHTVPACFERPYISKIFWEISMNKFVLRARDANGDLPSLPVAWDSYLAKARKLREEFGPSVEFTLETRGGIQVLNSKQIGQRAADPRCKC